MTHAELLKEIRNAIKIGKQYMMEVPHFDHHEDKIKQALSHLDTLDRDYVLIKRSEVPMGRGKLNDMCERSDLLHQAMQEGE